MHPRLVVSNRDPLVADRQKGENSARRTAAISETILSVTAGVDSRDFDRVLSAFADTVIMDRTSLPGGMVVTLSAEDVVAHFRSFMPGFDLTEHLVVNHEVVSINPLRAHVLAEFAAIHRIGDKCWALGGHNEFVLIRSGARWLIAFMKIVIQWEAGDRDLAQTARARVAEARETD